MADTRVEMTQTMDELKERAAEKVHAVTRRLDIGSVIREHPWPALGAAVVLGAVIAGSGADEAAAAAAVTGAKRASGASADAAKQLVEKVRSRHDDSEPHMDEAVASEPEKPGVIDRFFDGIGAIIAGRLDRLVDDMRVASRELGARMASGNNPQPVSARAPRPVSPAVVAPVAAAAILVAEDVAPRPADAVPVPNEIAPAELGLRADAVEAVGGGTQEPPLEEGAGELGARWS